MILLYTILTISIIFNIILFIRGMILVKQNEELADAILEADDVVEESQTTLEKMLDEMRALDIKGSFEADDEVGAVFTELKNLIEKYKN
jgi:hypothetical protein